jgi:hypothetical protein
MTGHTLRGSRRWLSGARIGAAAAALAAAVLPLGAASAQAGTTYYGTLRLTLNKVAAGATGDTLGWNYQAPLLKVVAGTISLDVPAPFQAPQAGTPGSPGYVSTTSTCAQFQVTGTTPQQDGSTVITVAVSCAKGLTGAISYAPGTEPTQAGKYVFAATFTRAGAAAVPFRQAHIVTVQHGPLASLVITPAASTIATGGRQAYRVRGLDAFGNSLGNVTGSSTFTITPDGRCGRSACTAAVNGPHTVTATDQGVSTTASLTVATLDADLSVTQTVSSSSPYYYAPVTFETTVTNNSSAFSSNGVTATVPEPSGLVSPSATPSGSTSYDPLTGTWTIGSLAPGASATLDITGDAGAVSLGTQTVTATATASTPDSNQSNNTASASEASQPAPIKAVITPDPNNPNPIDVSRPGTVTWYGSAVNAANPAAPPPVGFSTFFMCATASSAPCPPVAGLQQANVPLSFTTSTLSVDIYYITLATDLNNPTVTDPNYQRYQEVYAYTSFSTTSSG